MDKHRHRMLKNIPKVIIKHLTFIEFFFYIYFSPYGSQAVGTVCVLLTNIFPSPSHWRRQIHICWMSEPSGIDSHVNVCVLTRWRWELWSIGFIWVGPHTWAQSVLSQANLGSWSASKWDQTHMVNHSCSVHGAIILWLICLSCLVSEA